MLLSNEIIAIQPKTLNRKGKHLFWAAAPDKFLLQSLREFGQTMPVLAEETDKGMSLVTGHARVAALSEQGTPVLARMVRGADPISRGLLYLADNAQRPLDDGMRLDAMLYFSEWMDSKRLSAEILPRLGVRPGSKDAKALFTWLGMPEAWRVHLKAGRVPLASSTILARLKQDELDALEPFFSQLSWSRSNGVNFLTWLYEGARMHDCGIAQALEQAELPGMLTLGLSPKDTIARLSASARAYRFPDLTELQSRFTTLSRELSAGTVWRVGQADNFETGGVEISARIKNDGQLAKALSDLGIISESPLWERLFALGRSDD